MASNRNDWMEEYAYLWESGEWGLSHIYYPCAKISLRFDNSSISITEFAALRQLIPELTKQPLATLWNAIKGQQEITLGEFCRSEAYRLKEKADRMGLQLHMENTSYESYLPVNINKKSALIIEEEQLADQIAQMMLKRGVPIIQTAEAD